MKKILATLLVCLISICAFAQQKEISIFQQLGNIYIGMPMQQAKTLLKKKFPISFTEDELDDTMSSCWGEVEEFGIQFDFTIYTENNKVSGVYLTKAYHDEDSFSHGIHRIVTISKKRGYKVSEIIDGDFTVVTPKYHIDVCSYNLDEDKKILLFVSKRSKTTQNQRK